MKFKRFTVPMLAIFCAMNCFAQDTTVVLIPAGSSIAEKLPLAK
jgi:hypothetical protein